jgi:hypothetical protein
MAPEVNPGLTVITPVFAGHNRLGGRSGDCSPTGISSQTVGAQKPFCARVSVVPSTLYHYIADAAVCQQLCRNCAFLSAPTDSQRTGALRLEPNGSVRRASAARSSPLLPYRSEVLGQSHLKGVFSYKAAGPGTWIKIVDLPLVRTHESRRIVFLQNKPNSPINSYVFFSFRARPTPVKRLSTPLDRTFSRLLPRNCT